MEKRNVHFLTTISFHRTSIMIEIKMRCFWTFCSCGFCETQDIRDPVSTENRSKTNPIRKWLSRNLFQNRDLLKMLTKRKHLTTDPNHHYF